MKTLFQSLFLFLFFALTVSAAEKKIYLVVAADPSDPRQSEAFLRDVDTVKDAFSMSYDEAWDPLVPYETLRAKAHDTKYDADKSSDWDKYGVLYEVLQRCVIYNDPSYGKEGEKVDTWNGEPTIASTKFIDGKRQISESDKELDVLTNLKAALQSCPAGSDDTIVVYWSGHGAFKDNEHYLVTNNGTEIKRSEILDALKTKNVRLSVLLSDACANEPACKRQSKKTKKQMVEVEAAAPGEVREQVQKLKPPKPRIAPLFDELFFFHKGLVDINAAEKSQKAYTLLFSDETTIQDVDRRNRVVDTNTEMEERYMGIFTAAIFSDKQFSDYRIDTRGRTAAQDAQDFVNYYNPQTNRRRSRAVNTDTPLGLFEVNRIKRLTWSEVADRIQENVTLLLEKSAEAEGHTQKIAVWSNAEQIEDGLEERLKQDEQWKAEQYNWIKANGPSLRNIRGINPERLARAIQIAAIVLDILRAAGVNVPGIPAIPGIPGGGRIPRIPRLPF